MEIAGHAAASAETADQIFTTLVNAHVNEIYNYARYMVLDSDDADDITQKTFISLYKNISKLDLQKPIKPWLFKVAKNHSLDYFKAKKMAPFSELDDSVVQDIPETNASIEEQLHSDMFVETIKEQIKLLPLPAREVLLLKYFEEFTFEEIAEVLSISPNTVKSHFYRGKVKLLNLLEQVPAVTL